MNDLSRQIWDMKYRFRAGDGTPIDRDVADSWARVAIAAAQAEAPALRRQWALAFAQILAGYHFLPAGRILAGAGTGRSVTLFNCFVMGTIPDDMGGIFDHLREAALTMQQGGGIGYDFSTLRPSGAVVRGVGADASGPVSFMGVWDAMCRTIMSAGSRRGAMMATLACDHPDIETFIDAKRQPGELTMFNLSVLVSDAFMEAVRDGSPWELKFDGKVFRTVLARALWDRIMRSTYEVAEPGVIFIDRINAWNNLGYCEQISATNPCGEQPLPPYGACLLGSVNLAVLVRNPFLPDAYLDEGALEHLTRVAVRLLDNCIDVSRFPLPEQQREALAKRRIGLGVTGVADALAFCGVRYGTGTSLTMIDRWLGILSRSAYAASIELAREKGAFPLFDRDEYLDRPFVKTLPDPLCARLAEHGIRNGLLTSIAPTGTISLFAENVSSGIEPIFSYHYKRRLLMPDGSRREEMVSDYAYGKFRQMFGMDAALPDFFVAAHDLSPDDHVAIQAAAQKHIDSSISKTINVSEDMPFEDFKDIYLNAYASGCKGCTTYRPSPARGAVLEIIREPAQDDVSAADAGLINTEALQVPDDAAARPKEEAGSVVYMTKPLDRPEVLLGQTYKIKWPDSDHAFYITINDIEKAGRRRPFEIFINSKNMEAYAWTLALTRMISAVFRRGGDVSFVVHELKAVFDPRGGQWMAGQYVPSLLAAIGEVIERHLIVTGFMPPRETIVEPQSMQAAAVIAGEIRGRACPRCGSPALVRQEGCDTCMACGYSRCS
ncbi:MAG TPA: adenosylcobalamin-dependent ribonucleoside-diphosphate reductase [Rhizomicrobium sp.]|jgi:ribonucleoside-diphosphate reductase alpha chain